MKDIIPCCYFPTTVVFIDDQKGFLNSLELKLPELLDFKMYDDPLEAIEFLKEAEMQRTPFMTQWLNRIKDFDSDFDESHARPVIEIDLLSIHQIVYKKDRFFRPTVMVVDYAMPGSDGMACCRELKNSTIKKIMITGEATETLGVKAFNEGIIDRFILKTNPRFLPQLVDAIHTLQYQYFKDLSVSLIQSLSSQSLKVLEDPVFIEFFRDLCKKKNIIEYYLVDDEGSFLMLNKKGQVSWLTVKSDDTMNQYVALIKSGELAPTSVQTALSGREKIPFFLTEQDTEIANKDWSQYLHNATLLKGNTDYYYAYIDGVAAYDIQSKKIASYQQYLDQL